MATTVTMPQLGETVTEGTILSWAKQVGDTISEDEVLVEISTDKVDTEVPSPAAGVVLEILVPEGETVEVGTPLVVIGEAEGEEAVLPESTPAETLPKASGLAAAPDTAPAAEADALPQTTPTLPKEAPSQAPIPQVPAVTATSGEPPLFLSPVVRKLAREHNLDLSTIDGTGKDGRVTRKDVESLIAAGPPAAGEPARAGVAAAPAPAVPPPAPPMTAAGEDEVVELSRIRARIGRNMTMAKATAAHVWTSVEVDYERVERVRQEYRSAFKEEHGYSLTYLPFIARAAIDALRAYPVVNSSYYLEEKQAVFHKAIHLGIAIDLDQGGLIVATIRNAEDLRLTGLARRIRELAEKARANKLEPDDVAGSTFSITNPGPFGSFMSAPIINVPNVGILSTDTVVKRAVVITSDDGQDTIAIRRIGYLGLSWDHRAFDGSVAVLFLRRIKENLETWDWHQELA